MLRSLLLCARHCTAHILFLLHVSVDSQTPTGNHFKDVFLLNLISINSQWYDNFEKYNLNVSIAYWSSMVTLSSDTAGVYVN